MIKRLKAAWFKARLFVKCYSLLRPEIGRRASLLTAWRYIRAE